MNDVRILFQPPIHLDDILNRFKRNSVVVNFQFRCPGGTHVNFCWVCAAGLSEPLPHYSLFRGQL